MAKPLRKERTFLDAISDALKSVDFYRVLPKDMTEPTVTGASGKYLTTIYYLHSVSVFAMAMLFLMLTNQLFKFLKVNATSELTLIDPSQHVFASANKVTRECELT